MTGRFLLLLLLALAIPAAAQEKSPIEQAAQAARAYRWEEAERLLSEEAGRISRVEQPRQAAMVLLLLGDVEEAQGDLQQALFRRGEALDAARVSREASLVATAGNELGRTYLARGDTREAARLLNEALGLARRVQSPLLQARVLANQGNLDFALDRYPEAARKYREAQEVLQAAPDDAASQRLGAALLTNLGNVALREHREEEAAGLYRQARERAARAGDAVAAGRILLNLGALAETQGNYQAALELYRSAREEFKKQSLVTAQAQATLNIALLHQRLGGYEQALEGLRQALAALRQAGSELPAEWEAAMALNRAPLHRRLGQNELAAQILREALDRHRDRLSASELAALHSQLAALAADDGKLEEARAHYRTAAQLQSGSAQKASILLGQADLERRLGDASAAEPLYRQALEIASDPRQPLDSIQWRADFGLGLLARKAGRLEEALEHYRRSLGRLEAIRGRLTDQELTTSFAEDKHPLYEEVIDLLLEMGRPQEAFEMSERGRARALLDILRRGDVLNDRGLVAPLSLPQVQAGIPADTVVLSYYTAPDETYLFVVGRDRFAAQVVPPGRQELEKLIGDGTSPGRLRPPRQSSAGATFPAEIAADLYGKLVAPAEVPAGARLVVLPDGPLYYVPFALLKTPEGFLIEDHPIVYGPSASVLLAQPATGAPAGRVLVYAAPASGGPEQAGIDRGVRFPRSSFSPLPGAESEARQVAGHHAASDLRIGEQCRETLFYKESGQGNHAILHFATHGFADDRNPMQSGLLMSPEPAPQDGFLLARELYPLDLSARLAVLSACDTGLGRLAGGEGMVGLSRAFQVAGVSQVVASLWPVSDRGTRALMDEFHAALAAGAPSTSRALQKAQVALLHAAEGSEEARPYVWSPFVLIGRDW